MRTTTATRTSFKNITSRFCNSFAIIKTCLAWKMLANSPRTMNDVKSKEKERRFCRHTLTFLRKPKIWSFHVVVLQRPVKKCTKM